jgi:serine/threonine protein kinase
MEMVRQVDPFEIVGKRIDGKYDVAELVDQTSFSVVYRAEHVVWKRDVAIKAFKVSGELSEESRSGLLASFIQEGALLAELSERCTAICQARDMASFTTATGQWVPYMVLEWVEGQALDVVLEREREQGSPPRTVRDAVTLLAPIAEALALAHARGIVHCDVKPGNILLCQEAHEGHSQAKLLDFGVAKVLRGSWKDTIVEGAFTPAYGAPEQWSSEHGRQGPATDVFALALIVVELVTGNEALRGDDITVLAQESCDATRRPTPRTLGVEVSDETERVLSRALALNPWERYANAQEFWEALTAAAAKLPLEPPKLVSEPPQDTNVVIPLSRRRPRRRFAAASAFAVCVGAALVSSQSVGHAAWLGAVTSFPSGSYRSSVTFIAALATTSSVVAPLLGTLCVVATALCMGTLFSVSWLCGRARMMADGAEIARLSMQLFRRWTVPSLVVAFVAGVASCAIVAQEQPHADWLYGVAVAGLAIVGLTAAVARRAARLVRGTVDAIQGEGTRRFALVLTVWAALALAVFHPSLLP